MTQKQVYEIDGTRCSTLEAFYAEISRVVIPDAEWGHNLDAFNDILRGGFGTPDEGFILRWNHADRSRTSLGYAETVRQLQRRIQRCHPDNIPFVLQELSQAEQGQGPTVFDWLVEIIQDHGPGGHEADSDVKLILA